MSYSTKIVKKCRKCGRRIFDKITPTSGIIEIKCPQCKQVIEIDLSYRMADGGLYRSVSHH